MEKSKKDLKDTYSRFLALGLGLCYMGKNVQWWLIVHCVIICMISIHIHQELVAKLLLASLLFGMVNFMNNNLNMMANCNL